MGISSPLLKQAGFVKSKIAVAIEWVAELDGVAQSWQLSETIILFAGDKVKFKYRTNPEVGKYRYLLDSSSDDANRGYILLNNAGRVTYPANLMRVYVDGSLLTSNSLAPADNVVHDVTVEVLNTMSIDKMGSRFNSIDFMSGWLEDFQLIIGGGVSIIIPLTNKSQGANQLPTIGAVSAVMANYTAAVWKNKAKL